MDALEKILAEEETIRPSPGFTDRVMRAVREEAREQEPLEFPWARFLPGMILDALLVLAALFWMAGETGPPSRSSTPFDPAILEALASQDGFWALVAMGATAGLSWAVVKWTSSRPRLLV